MKGENKRAVLSLPLMLIIYWIRIKLDAEQKDGGSRGNKGNKYVAQVSRPDAGSISSAECV